MEDLQITYNFFEITKYNTLYLKKKLHSVFPNTNMSLFPTLMVNVILRSFNKGLL